eukprot:TRINITY_DN1082_c0_g1_i21.p1 TRINITY_DN1082_c0_g1~~TRINITY_DN1082_c0_g1_i21.p1  ORF type:complete len:371 (+),score=14.42 TRINITY_DN1082_c0_g1_i21:24-1136(+)
MLYYEREGGASFDRQWPYLIHQFFRCSIHLVYPNKAIHNCQNCKYPIKNPHGYFVLYKRSVIRHCQSSATQLFIIHFDTNITFTTILLQFCDFAFTIITNFKAFVFLAIFNLQCLHFQFCFFFFFFFQIFQFQWQIHSKIKIQKFSDGVFEKKLCQQKIMLLFQGTVIKDQLQFIAYLQNEVLLRILFFYHLKNQQSNFIDTKLNVEFHSNNLYLNTIFFTYFQLQILFLYFPNAISTQQIFFPNNNKLFKPFFRIKIRSPPKKYTLFFFEYYFFVTVFQTQFYIYYYQMQFQRSKETVQTVQNQKQQKSVQTTTKKAVFSLHTIVYKKCPQKQRKMPPSVFVLLSDLQKICWNCEFGHQRKRNDFTGPA